MIRVFVVASSEVVRAGLVSLIAASQGQGVSISGSGASLPSDLSGTDVILTDAQFIGDAAVDGPPLIVLTSAAATSWLDDEQRSPVRGVLAENATGAEIMAAIHAVANGLVVFPATELVRVNSTARRSPPSDLLEPLTARETEVLRMVAEGTGNKNIAWKLGISEHTVKFHLASIYAKLNVSTRTEAVAVGARMGLIML